MFIYSLFLFVYYDNVGILGGIAEYTCDINNLCENSGYDTVLIESVGVGQNEVELDEVSVCLRNGHYIACLI